MHAIGRKGKDDDCLQDYLGYVEPHEEVAPATADGEILVHGVKGHEGSTDAEHLKERYAPQPRTADGDEDELSRHERQAQHEGHGEKCREAYHLAVNMVAVIVPVPVPVISALYEHGLGKLPHGVGDEGVCHGVPLERLRVVAHLTYWEESAEDDGKNIVGGGIDNLCYEYPEGKGRHLPYGGEVEGEAWAPFFYVIVAPQVDDADIGYLLPHQRPVGEAEQGEGDACGT